jgi:hypothetical protein
MKKARASGLGVRRKFIWRNGEMEAQAYWGADVGIGERGIHRLKGCFIFE